jgi:hypothetical protein
VGVVARYGATTAVERAFIAAASCTPVLSDDDLAGVCGTCQATLGIVGKVA